MTTTETQQTAPFWTLGERLQKAREHAGISRDEMSARLDVSERTIRNYENEAVKVTRAVVLAYSAETSVSMEWLTDDLRSRCFSPGDPPGQLSFSLAA